MGAKTACDSGDYRRIPPSRKTGIPVEKKTTLQMNRRWPRSMCRFAESWARKLAQYMTFGLLVSDSYLLISTTYAVSWMLNLTFNDYRLHASCMRDMREPRFLLITCAAKVGVLALTQRWVECTQIPSTVLNRNIFMQYICQFTRFPK